MGGPLTIGFIIKRIYILIHQRWFLSTDYIAKEKFIVDTSPEAGGGEERSKVKIRDPESPIPVIEERLEVSKKESVVEAKVIKKPVKETKTVVEKEICSR